MGKSCCACTSDQNAGTFCAAQNSSRRPQHYRTIEQIAKSLNYTQAIKIIRLQARSRGMLVRNRLRQDPQFATFMAERDRIMCIDRPNYDNRRVWDIRMKLGAFDYGNIEEQMALLEIDQMQLEYRKEQVIENQSKYEGQWVKSTQFRTGRGRQKWPDGSLYEGWLCEGRASGRGRLIHAHGEIYDGQWLDDQAHGKGIYYHLDGAKYEGDWFNNEQHGYGVETWNDGAKYSGFYVNGRKNGKGTFTWLDGNAYYGDFEDNNIQGQGLYKWSDGRKYEGTWVNNKMDGTGIFEWVDGRRYEGAYIDDKKEGFGVFYWPDGRKYEGQWKNGRQHGNGKYTTAMGQVMFGEWQDGKRIKWQSADDGPSDQQSQSLQ